MPPAARGVWLEHSHLAPVHGPGQHRSLVTTAPHGVVEPALDVSSYGVSLIRAASRRSIEPFDPSTDPSFWLRSCRLLCQRSTTSQIASAKAQIEADGRRGTSDRSPTLRVRRPRSQPSRTRRWRTARGGHAIPEGSPGCSTRGDGIAGIRKARGRGCRTRPKRTPARTLHLLVEGTGCREGPERSRAAEPTDQPTRSSKLLRAKRGAGLCPGPNTCFHPRLT